MINEILGTSMHTVHSGWDLVMLTLAIYICKYLMMRDVQNMGQLAKKFSWEQGKPHLKHVCIELRPITHMYLERAVQAARKRKVETCASPGAPIYRTR